MTATSKIAIYAALHFAICRMSMNIQITDVALTVPFILDNQTGKNGTTDGAQIENRLTV